MIDLGLFHRKPAPFTGIHQPIGFKITFEEDSFEIKPSDPKNIAEFLEQMTVKDKIKQVLLSGGRMSAKQISEDIESPLNTVSVSLKRMGKMVKQFDDKTWGIVINDSHVTEE